MLPFILSSILFLLFHFGLSLPITAGFFIPQAAFIPLGLVMLIRGTDLKNVSVALALSFIVLGLGIWTADNHLVGIYRRLLSGGQFVYTFGICATVAFARPLEEVHATRTARFCQGFAVLILVLGLLEIFTTFKQVSDAFRSAVYLEGLYASDARDFQLAGFIRPKTFASEPSHAAWSLCMLVLCSIAFRPTRTNFITAFCILLIGTLIFFSPNTAVTAVFLVSSAVVLFWDQHRIKATIATLSIATLVALPAAILITGSLLGQRVNALTGYEGSYYVRLVQPLEMARAALAYNWMFGVGFGGVEAIWTHIAIIESGASGDNINRAVGMALFTIPLFLGTLGVLLFILLLWWIIRHYGARIGLAIAGVLVFTLLQKQSFVITTAWIIAAIWAMQLKTSLIYLHAKEVSKKFQIHESNRV